MTTEKIKITEQQEAIIIKHRNMIFENLRQREGENISHNYMHRIITLITDRFNIMLQEDFNTTDFIERYKREQSKGRGN